MSHALIHPPAVPDFPAAAVPGGGVYLEAFTIDERPVWGTYRPDGALQSLRVVLADEDVNVVGHAQRAAYVAAYPDSPAPTIWRVIR